MYVKKKILVVDDNAINRKILNKMLSEDYEVVEAANGKEAFEKIDEAKGQVAAVLLDLMMPVMDGYEFLKIANENNQYVNIPILVSTGNSDRENEKKALRLGAWDFISKPYEAEIIKFRLKNAIDRSLMTAYEQLKYLSEYDVMTELYNKNKFFAVTREMLDNNGDRQYVFIRMDINRFSLINSYYGTKEGDRLLKFTASHLRSIAQQYSLITYGRIEADEFACCMAYTDDKQIMDFLAVSKEQFKEYKINFNIVPVYGIYKITDNSMAVDTMYDNANLAAKKIKGNYIKNYCIYTDDMRENLATEQTIINEMGDALEQEQFVVYLQPKYSLKNNKPAGSEALVRWIHPQKGMISPGVFIPVFEGNGFIEKLDYYMWEHTCRIIRGWIDKGITPLPVSVNVSRVNLYNPLLVDTICELVDRYKIPHELFQLEITESAYTDNQSVIYDTIEKIHANGFIALMDDFGSGYSSLNILKDIDVDVIKIDMKFFEKTEDLGRSQSIVSSVVRMAKWLNITVIAEGVETYDQVEFLRTIGCEYVQGYYFARPMPVNEYEELINKDTEYKHAEPDENVEDKTWILNPKTQQLLSGFMQPIGIYEVEGDKIECIRVNGEFYETFGYEDKILYSNLPMNVIDEGQRDSVLAALNAVLLTHGEEECEYLRHCLNGKQALVRVKIKYIDKVGSRNIVLCTFSDITQRRQIDTELNKFRSAMNARQINTNRMLIVDDEEMNRELLREIFKDEYIILTASNGQEAIEILAQNNNKVDVIILDMMMPVMDGTEFLEYKKNHLEIMDIPVIIFTADDSPEMQVKTLSLGADDYITKPFVPAVVQKRVENVIESHQRFVEIVQECNATGVRSREDQLTGVYNKANAERLIDRVLETQAAGNHAFVLIEIDNFQSINDRYGRAKGDETLMLITRILKKFFRSNDIIARIGGDEFVIFMINVPSAEMVENKCNALADKLNSEEQEIKFTISIGVAMTNKEPTKFTKLMDNAGMALYQSKSNGRNQVTRFQ